MSYKLKLTAVVLTAAAIGGGYEIYQQNHLPSFVLPALTDLPPELPQAGGADTIVCATDTQPCNGQTAWAVLAVGGHREELSHTDFVKLQTDKPEVLQAFIAKEDQRFYDPGSDGCDVKAIVRAAKIDVSRRITNKLHITHDTRNDQGGSTIPR